jgi:aryl carrier-like protein
MMDHDEKLGKPYLTLILEERDMDRTQLTADRIRADVADVLSLAPEEIADDAHLLDQGMDSIRLMTLVERWRDEGADVDLVDLAEQPTVAQWVALLAR